MKYSILHSPCGMIDATDISHTKKSNVSHNKEDTFLGTYSTSIFYIYIYIAFRFLAFLDHVTME